MARLGTIARRSFLVGAAAIAGGIAFGTYVVMRPHDNPLEDLIGEGDATFNPFVKISKDAVTLIVPHTDVGQGARSVQAMLIAEEMDIALDQVTLSPGIPSPAYYNDGGVDEAVPYSPVDTGVIATSLRGAASSAVKALGVMSTGGSTTVPNQFTKLREAGAMARETLKLAAAQRTGMAVADLRTADGAVILPDGTRLAYTDLAAEAANVTPVKDTPLRDPSEWRLIGKPVQRTDIVAKSTGTLEFGIDLEFDGMLHAAVRRNPRIGGAMKSYDASAAERMRGVTGIVPVEGGVAVLADNTWRAIRAAEAIEIEWGPAPYPAEMDAHWQAVEDSFTEERLDSTRRDDGDTEAALSALDGTVIKAEYRAPYLAHAPLEPLSAVVLVGPERVDVWAGSQLPIFHRDNVAGVVGVDPEKVHLHNQYCGGSFGLRLEDSHIRTCAEIAMAMPGVPIKLTHSREEDFAQDFPRPLGIGRMRGVARNGKVDTLDLGIAGPGLLASQFGRSPSIPTPPGADGALIQGTWDQPLAIPNFRVRGYRTPLDAHAPVSSWRSVGSSANAFFLNSALDEVILAAGGDPLEERLRLIDDAPSRKTVEAVAEMSGWGTDLGPNRGRGIAFCMSFGAPTAEVVEVTMTADGIRIDKVFVAAEVGIVVDPVNFENQVMGGVIWGLGHAMNCEITYSDGMAEQANYYDFEAMRIHQCPEIHVRGLENGDKVRGIGEPPVPPAAPALAGAIFAATGQRLREMPFNKFIDFA